VWGAQSLGEPRPDEIITTDSIVMALRASFRPETAHGLRAVYELRLGDVTVHARVDNGTLQAGAGSLADADLVLETGPAIRAIMAGEVRPAEAIENGSVRLSGSPELFTRFAELFHIPKRPAVA
jgi:hypothetical protein